MQYRFIEDRIVNNVGANMADPNQLKLIKYDVMDTLREIFTISESPLKQYRVIVNDSITTKVETFADVTPPTNPDLSNVDEGDLAISVLGAGTNKLLWATSDTPLKVTGVNTLTNLNVSAYSADAGFPTIPPAKLRIRIYRNDVTEQILFDSTFDIGVTDAVPIDIPLDIYDFDLTIEMSPVWIDDLATDISQFFITGFTYKETVIALQMPEDFILPFELTAHNTLRTIKYRTARLTESEFMRWNPSLSAHVYENDSVTEKFVDANLEVDNETELKYTAQNTLAYNFSVRESGIYLQFKPAFEGEINILYCYVPYMTFEAANTIKITDAYVDMVVLGATIRGLLRKLNNKMNSEIVMAAIRTQLQYYFPLYLSKLSDYSYRLLRDTKEEIPDRLKHYLGALKLINFQQQGQ